MAVFIQAQQRREGGQVCGSIRTRNRRGLCALGALQGIYCCAYVRARPAVGLVISRGGKILNLLSTGPLWNFQGIFIFVFLELLPGPLLDVHSVC